MNEEVGFLEWQHHEESNRKMDSQGCFSGFDVSRADHLIKHTNSIFKLFDQRSKIMRVAIIQPYQTTTAAFPRQKRV